MNIKEIQESEKVVNYLIKRKLLKQYKKSKNYILKGKEQNTKLKKKQPKTDNVYYFRINKQYRAVWDIEKWIFTIFEISNHQD